MESQQRAREIMLRQPLYSADKIYEQEFSKGEAAGIGLVLAMPQQIIDVATNELKQQGVDDNESP